MVRNSRRGQGAGARSSGTHNLHELADLNADFELASNCFAKKSQDGRDIDTYCWMCHKPGQDIICNICPRVFHQSCVKGSKQFTPEGVCCECQLESVDGASLSFVPVENLRRLLKTALLRVRDVKRSGQGPTLFEQWHSLKMNTELCKIVDFEFLIDKINGEPPYTKTVEFFSDCKWFLHNSAVLFGVTSKQEKFAKEKLKNIKNELIDMEACFECYEKKHSKYPNFFVEKCRNPHDIIWAKMKGYPYWPAKCYKVIKNMAHVQFFGEHGNAKVPIAKCYFMSEKYPLSDEPKTKLYKISKAELNLYIINCRKRGLPFQFSPRKTDYVKEKNDVNLSASSSSFNNECVADMEVEPRQDDLENIPESSFTIEIDNAEQVGCELIELEQEESAAPTVVELTFSPEKDKSPQFSITGTYSIPQAELEYEKGFADPLNLVENVDQSVSDSIIGQSMLDSRSLETICQQLLRDDSLRDFFPFAEPSKANVIEEAEDEVEFLGIKKVTDYKFKQPFLPPSICSEELIKNVALKVYTKAKASYDHLYSNYTSLASLYKKLVSEHAKCKKQILHLVNLQKEYMVLKSNEERYARKMDIGKMVTDSLNKEVRNVRSSLTRKDQIINRFKKGLKEVSSKYEVPIEDFNISDDEREQVLTDKTDTNKNVGNVSRNSVEENASVESNPSDVSESADQKQTAQNSNASPKKENDKITATKPKSKSVVKSKFSFTRNKAKRKYNREMVKYSTENYKRRLKKKSEGSADHIESSIQLLDSNSTVVDSSVEVNVDKNIPISINSSSEENQINEITTTLTDENTSSCESLPNDLGDKLGHSEENIQERSVDGGDSTVDISKLEKPETNATKRATTKQKKQANAVKGDANCTPKAVEKEDLTGLKDHSSTDCNSSISTAGDINKKATIPNKSDKKSDIEKPSQLSRKRTMAQESTDLPAKKATVKRTRSYKNYS